jgi:hypothetical protein
MLFPLHSMPAVALCIYHNSCSSDLVCLLHARLLMCAASSFSMWAAGRGTGRDGSDGVLRLRFRRNYGP